MISARPAEGKPVTANGGGLASGESYPEVKRLLLLHPPPFPRSALSLGLRGSRLAGQPSEERVRGGLPAAGAAVALGRLT